MRSFILINHGQFSSEKPVNNLNEVNKDKKIANIDQKPVQILSSTNNNDNSKILQEISNIKTEISMLKYKVNKNSFYEMFGKLITGLGTLVGMYFGY